MYRQICYAVLVFMLGIGTCFPCIRSPHELLTAGSDEYPPRLNNYSFQQMTIESIIRSIAETECIKVVFDDSVTEFVKSTEITLRVLKASPVRALSIVLDTQNLNGEYTSDRNLIVFRGKVPERVKLTDIVYSNVSFVTAIEQISQVVGLKIRLHGSAQVYSGASLTITLRGGSLLRGLELILNSRRLTYEYVDCKTILVFADESIWLN